MEEIPNTLKAFQDAVGGYIETVSYRLQKKPILVICNEEGLLRGLPYNCHIQGQPYVGPIVICGVDGPEFTDVPITLEQFKELYLD
ncbi:MAG: DUF3846 domain-containing protein [Lachnospiraceae bacterium]|nr:DUF3846 domain-containing protein [Lachnospiraceae bacterium]